MSAYGQKRTFAAAVKVYKTDKYQLSPRIVRYAHVGPRDFLPVTLQ
jgi:hypothetical protein